jgi:hypothetical protein
MTETILMELPVEMIWEILDTYLCLKTVTVLTISNKKLRDFIYKSYSIQHDMDGIVCTLQFLEGPKHFQLCNLKVSTTKSGKNKKKLFMECLTYEVNKPNVTELSFHDCNSNFEALIGSLDVKVLNGLNTLSIVKFNGSVSVYDLKSVIINGKNLKRLELLCHNLSHGLLIAFTVKQIQQMKQIRLMCANIFGRSLFHLLGNLTTNTNHFEFYSSNSNSGYHIEYLSGTYDRKDITQPRSDMSYVSRPPGDCLVMIGEIVDEIFTKFCTGTVMPWWIINLETLVLSITLGVSSAMFANMMRGNPDLSSLDLKLLAISFPMEELRVGLRLCNSLEFLILCGAVKWTGSELVKLIGAVPSLIAVQIVFHPGINFSNINQMFIDNSALEIVWTYACACVTEITLHGASIVEVYKIGEWTFFTKKNWQLYGPVGVDGSLRSHYMLC